MESRLSSLDASFLGLERGGAHMHVGWLAHLDPPLDRPPPTFEEVRGHIERRLPRAPRYRQRLESVPLAAGEPVWVDDERFDICRHVHRAAVGDAAALVDEVMSSPLPRDRPLWEIWVLDDPPSGGLALVGKAHHCMVDGLAMVQLASLLLHPGPEPDSPPEDGWSPAPAPGRLSLLRGAVAHRLGATASVAAGSARLALDPRQATAGLRRVRQVAGALAGALDPAPSVPGLPQGKLSSRRHLAFFRRDLGELRHVRRRFDTTVNDVVLATAAGGLRSYLLRHGDDAPPLKALVPVSVRTDAEAGALGNRISFMFCELPCDLPDPVARLRAAHVTAAAARAGGEPAGARDVLSALDILPPPLQAPISRLVSGPRAFNLAVSNVPGPREPLYMLGCRLAEAYPVVPIAEDHSLSIGFTSICEGAFFGVYADPRALPDADELAGDLAGALDELVEAASARRTGRFTRQERSGSRASSFTSVSASSDEGSDPDTIPHPE